MLLERLHFCKKKNQRYFKVVIRYVVDIYNIFFAIVWTQVYILYYGKPRYTYSWQ